jgi:hypothetical protein
MRTAMSDRLCLRCDWIGTGEGVACPECDATLYRLGETEPIRGAPVVAATSRAVPAKPPPGSFMPRGVGQRSSAAATPATEDAETAIEPGPGHRHLARMNPRLAAGVAGITVFLSAVGFFTRGGPIAGTRTSPADPGGSVTGPSAAGPSIVTVASDTARAGFIGLPPLGARASTPKRGDLVMSDTDIHPWFSVNVYTDGRLIWAREGPLPEGANETETGWLEQRLTPEGVELLRSGTVPLEGQYAYPGSQLPAGAWEDPVIRAYVPSRYAACYWYRGPRSPAQWTLFSLLPHPAQILLGRAQRTYDFDLGAGASPQRMRCHDVMTRKARELDDILHRAEVERTGTWQNWIEYGLDAPEPIGGAVVIWVIPLLPHGEWEWAGG